MRSWIVGVLVAVVALSTLGSATAARLGAAASLPLCKSGQVSSKAHPCSKPPVAKAPVTKTTSSVPLPTTPPVPVSDPNPDTGVPNPDTADTGVRVCGCDADTVLHYIDPMAGTYQLQVFNTSAIGWINSVNWLPPNGLTVTAITATNGGTCTLDAGDISCTANSPGLAPPKCTCETGGSMTVNFTASGDAPSFNGSWWTYYGVVGAYMQITAMTPVPYHIPSFIAPKNGGV